MSRTRVDGEKSPKDQYFTPTECIIPIAERLSKYPFDVVVDVGSGDGRIINAIYDIYPKRKTAWYAVEPYFKFATKKSKIYYLETTFQDFAQSKDWHNTDGRVLVISNPPYSQLVGIHPLMNRMVESAMPGSMLVMLLRLDYLAGKSRAMSGVFDSKLEMTNIFTLSPRPKFNNSRGNDSGDYAWVVWQNLYKPLGRTHESLLWKK